MTPGRDAAPALATGAAIRSTGGGRVRYNRTARRALNRELARIATADSPLLAASGAARRLERYWDVLGEERITTAIIDAVDAKTYVTDEEIARWLGWASGAPA